MWNKETEQEPCFLEKTYKTEAKQCHPFLLIFFYVTAFKLYKFSTSTFQIRFALQFLWSYQKFTSLLAISRTPAISAVISSTKTYQRKIRLPQQFITAVKKLSNIKGLPLIIFLGLSSVQKNKAANCMLYIDLDSKISRNSRSYCSIYGEEEHESCTWVGNIWQTKQ